MRRVEDNPFIAASGCEVLFRYFVTRFVHAQFAELSKGNLDRILWRADKRVHHRFAGEHALGGERHTREALAQWVARLGRLCPQMRFTVESVVVSGWIWDLQIAAEWRATIQPVAGPPYRNRGVHIIRLRRGRLVELLAYEDSQVVAQACRLMADLGVEEAAAPPITG